MPNSLSTPFQENLVRTLHHLIAQKLNQVINKKLKQGKISEAQKADLDSRFEGPLRQGSVKNKGLVAIALRNSVTEKLIAFLEVSKTKTPEENYKSLMFLIRILESDFEAAKQGFVDDQSIWSKAKSSSFWSKATSTAETLLDYCKTLKEYLPKAMEMRVYRVYIPSQNYARITSTSEDAKASANVRDLLNSAGNIVGGAEAGVASAAGDLAGAVVGHLFFDSGNITDLLTLPQTQLCRENLPSQWFKSEVVKGGEEKEDVNPNFDGNLGRVREIFVVLPKEAEVFQHGTQVKFLRGYQLPSGSQQGVVFFETLAGAQRFAETANNWFGGPTYRTAAHQLYDVNGGWLKPESISSPLNEWSNEDRLLCAQRMHRGPGQG